MRQLVVLSGKGGTGKTAVAAALLHLAHQDGAGTAAVAVDADVDASNLEILVGRRRLEEHEFWGGEVARIDFARCGGCGDCESVCRFDAIRRAERWGFEVDPLSCEGCAACYYQCPYDAIDLIPRRAGSWYRSESVAGTPFFHASLLPAQESSGKLVALIREQARGAAARSSYPLIIVDGPPGIACPAIAASTGADLALIVTEPTAAGLHDLRRALDMTAHFQLDRVVCVNKHDLHPDGTEAIATECRERRVERLESIPFDDAVPTAMAAGRPVTEYYPGAPAARAIERLWQQLRPRLGLDGGHRDLVTLKLPERHARSGNGGS